LKFDIVVLPGDGIGPEVVAEGVRVLEAVGKRYGHTFNRFEDLVGAVAIEKYGIALRPETMKRARSSKAILFGAVGDPKGDDARIIREALFPLRKDFGLYANLRPIKVHPSLVNSTPLKPEVIRGVDLLVIRELTGGLYFGKPKRQWQNASGRQGVDSLRYSEKEIKRILKVGFDLARQRRKKLTSVDKANVLETSRLWRKIAGEMSAEYPDVKLDHLYVDNCGMQLLRQPTVFDVIVTENTFGDILTDEASVLMGSIGMAPSASLGKPRKDGTSFGLYEPIHGTAPDIVGQSKANPLATILSVAMLLRHSLGLAQEAKAVEDAVEQVLQQGYRTPDLATAGQKAVTTAQMGKAVVDAVLS